VRPSYFIVLRRRSTSDKHPEWYSLIDENESQPPREHATLCLTNERCQKGVC